MNCKEVKRALKYGNSFDRNEVVDHTGRCENCREDLALESLTTALMNVHISDHKSNGEMIEENPYLITRIRARIRELGEQGVTSWESAILALRGWVVAFGTAAVLLVAISAQWQSTNMSAANDNDADLSTLSSLNEDYISGNINGPGKSPETLNPVSEAVRDAHK